MKIGPEVTVRQLTREVLEKNGPLEGHFRPYTRVTDETSELLAELNHEEPSGFVFTKMGPTEADTFHYEHRLIAAYCRKHGIAMSGPALLALDGDALILQALNYQSQPVGEAYRIPFVPQMETAAEPAPQIYLRDYPSDERPK
jgi:hypothetical protein